MESNGREDAMPRIRTRTRKGTRPRRDPEHRISALEDVRNRRYIAFVRAIVGAARSRNSSR
jgi:flagellar motor switch protein FliM/N